MFGFMGTMKGGPDGGSTSARPQELEIQMLRFGGLAASYIRGRRLRRARGEENSVRSDALSASNPWVTRCLTMVDVSFKRCPSRTRVWLRRLRLA